MSTPEETGASHEILIEQQTHAWDRDTISIAEIRSLGNLPGDCPVVAVDLAAGKEQVLDEDYVHELPPLQPGKPMVKRMCFKRGS